MEKKNNAEEKKRERKRTIRGTGMPVKKWND
jgi:hypothetical protein